MISAFSGKLYIWRRWLFISAVAVQLLVAAISILLMSSVRVVVTGESLWSKGFYAAFMHLQRYAETGAAQEYLDFQSALSIPLGDSEARKALDAGAHDTDALRAGLLQGENHPDDVDIAVAVLPWVWQLPALASTLQLWREGDAHALQLQQLGETIHAQRSTGSPPTAQDLQAWRMGISRIKNTAIPLATQFSASLGTRSRQLGDLLLLVNLLTALGLSMLYWLSVQRAVRENNKAYGELEVERLRSGVTLAALGDGVLTLDTEQRIRYANPAACELLDMPLGHLLGRRIDEILPFAAQLLDAAAPVPGPSTGQKLGGDNIHWLTHSDQEKVAVRVSVTHLQQEDVHSGLVVVMHNVSQEQNYMRMLTWQQSHDLLTGLDNRNAFEKYLAQALGKHPASLLHMNLDHFKMINASYGHAAGDEILRQVCQQLRLALRESDVMARIGGDEFGVLLNHCQPHAAMQTAERLRQCVHELNVQWHQHNLHTGVSIGVVHIDPNHSSHHSDPQILLGMADSACKHAKDTGRNRITVYNPFNRVFQRYQGDMEWVQRLRSSLEEDKFMLYAQTVYPLQPQGKGMDGVHFEVLLRLADKPGVPLSPAEFIPIAERYDLMTQIDRWVVRRTLKLLQWHLAQGANISTCAINLSGTSLGDSELLEFIRHNIVEKGVAAEKLCFEITETSAIASMDSATSMIQDLRALGCRFSLDDFGSGMASFKYLQQLPVDFLKIDGSFVRDMLKNSSNLAMVESINHIGHVMGKRTVAEFVGDAATYEALRSMGVDYAQGYYIATPVPLDAAFFEQALRPPPQRRVLPGNHHSSGTPRT